MWQEQTRRNCKERKWRKKILLNPLENLQWATSSYKKKEKSNERNSTLGFRMMPLKNVDKHLTIKKNICNILYVIVCIHRKGKKWISLHAFCMVISGDFVNFNRKIWTEFVFWKKKYCSVKTDIKNSQELIQFP